METGFLQSRLPNRLTQPGSNNVCLSFRPDLERSVTLDMLSPCFTPFGQSLARGGGKDFEPLILLLRQNLTTFCYLVVK